MTAEAIDRSTDAEIDVSVIVPAWNEEFELPATLERLRLALAALGRSHELIVVDDASTDRTAEIARCAGATVLRVEKRQIAAVRNAGARIARGRRLVFVDADTRVPDATLAAAMGELDAGAVGGGARVAMEGRVPLLVRPSLFVFMRVWDLLGYAAGCFVYCTKRDFDAVGGFDESFYASEEVWLSKALKARGRFVIVEPAVVSSGRKVRMHRPLPLLAYALKLLLRGPNAWKRREGLDLWYDGRREA
jgi:glycosyltransferase involved in cell wall biosynthesis